MTIISANVFDYMLHVATTVLHENSIKKKSDNASKCHLKIPPNPKWNSPSQRRFDLNRITKTKTGEIVVSLLSPITLRPSFSVAINIPLCCLSQNYRNSNRGNTYIYIYGAERRIHDNLPHASGVKLPSTRFHRPEITRIESTRCNANNIVPPPLTSLLCTPVIAAPCRVILASSWLARLRVEPITT